MRQRDARRKGKFVFKPRRIAKNPSIDFVKRKRSERRENKKGSRSSDPLVVIIRLKFPAKASL